MKSTDKNMKRKIPAAPHRIIGTDTPLTIADRKKIRAAIEAEKDDLIAQGRQLMADAKKEKAALSTIIQSLRLEREKQGLTLTDIANQTGIARESIHRLEAAINTNPTVNTLNRYANALGLELQLSVGKAKPTR